MDEMTAKSLFSRLKAHSIEGMVFHDQMSQYFDFLGLTSYAQMHRYHYAEETKQYQKLVELFFDEYDMLIPSAPMEKVNVIPESWYSYHGEDVDSATIVNAARNGMQMWVDWETKTKELFKEAYKSSDKQAISQMAACRYMDVDEELTYATEKYKEVQQADYNMIVSSQENIENEYSY